MHLDDEIAALRKAHDQQIRDDQYNMWADLWPGWHQEEREKLISKHLVLKDDVDSTVALRKRQVRFI